MFGRFHPSKTNDKECNAAVLAFVAGQVASEEDPKSTFVYLVFCDEHGVWMHSGNPKTGAHLVGSRASQELSLFVCVNI